MRETYPCPFANCGKVFSKMYELKKHKVTHEDPDRVFYCQQCDFITLQKKNLGIHVATHTGEKIHQCPDIIHFDSSPCPPAREERCKYRTNDPAALTRHRKKVHGYIPPSNRSRPAKAGPRKAHQKKDRKVSRRPRPFECPVSISCHKPSRTPHPTHGSPSGSVYSSTSTQSSKDPSPFSQRGDTQSMDSGTFDVSGCASSPFPREGDAHGQTMDLNTSDMSGADSSPFLWQGDIDAYGRSVDADHCLMTGYDPSIFGCETSMSPCAEMELNTLYDASLYSLWTAEYEEGYSAFGETGLKYHPEPLQAAPPPALLGHCVPTGQVGWMVESDIKGWDQSVLEAYGQLDA